MPRRRRRAGPTAARLLVAIAALALASIAPPAGAAPAYATLRPGDATAALVEVLPIQVVLVGYEADLLPAQWLRDGFVRTSRPIHRARRAAGIREEVGIEYRYDIRVVHADQAYEDALFGHLAAIGVPERRLTGHDTSLGQFAYDQQRRRSADVHDNLVIEAVDVERWLLEHPAPGIDPARDTAVLMSWWGRPDFRFHDYRVPREPASDTGVDWSLRDDRRVIAWGGTSALDEESGLGRESRTWFHDLSAGPDIWTDGWAIDATWGMEPTPARAYVMPPVWEYLTPGGARRPDQLVDDLYVLLRFVAVNLLFTPSPLYAVELDGHRVPADVEVDVTVYDADRPTRLTPPQVARELGELMGPVRIDVERRPLVGEPRRCIEGYAAGSLCRPELEARGYPAWSNPFLTAARASSGWRDGSAAHEIGAFVYPAPTGGPYTGFAGDNWIDGTKSGAWALVPAAAEARGLSQTATLVHEVGHHAALSHPHDGWEPEYEFSYSADRGGYLYLAWVGDEVSSVMSYLNVQEDFSQFDLDSYRRYRAAAAFRASNAIAADVLAAGPEAGALAALADADAELTEARRALAAHDYRRADERARAAHLRALDAAAAAGVAVRGGEDHGWELLDAGRRVGPRSSGEPGADRIADRERTDEAAARWRALRERGGAG